MPFRTLLLLLLLPALGLTAPPLAHAWNRASPGIAGIMTDVRLTETSGIAPSRRQPGRFWVHNDSGNDAELHLMSAEGSRLASVVVEGVSNIDWEDLAGFELDGKPYLLIADTGDNGGIRQTLQLIVVEEPAVITDGMRLRAAWVLRFRWPDGARDCEAVAVDAAIGQILLISKKRVPPELFALELRATDGEVQTARALGLLHGIAQPTAEERARNPRFGRYRSQVTAADLSPDGRTLAVLNYQSLYLYTREAGEPWPATLGRPQHLDFAWMPQAEAVTFSIDGHELWVAGEQRPSPLIRFRRAPP